MRRKRYDGFGGPPSRSTDLHTRLPLSVDRRAVRWRTDPPWRALRILRAAAMDAPLDPTYSYVYAVALDSYGLAARALRTLEKTHRHFPSDRPIVKVLAGMERDRGHREAALAYAQSLVALAPDDPESQALLSSLR